MQSVSDRVWTGRFDLTMFRASHDLVNAKWARSEARLRKGALRMMAQALAAVTLATTTWLSSGHAAFAETRTLDLVNEYTQEHLTITFKKDGHYIPEALAELNHFLRDWRRNEEIRMDPRLFDVVWEVYQKTGVQEPVHVICGYRALATNNMLRTRSRMVAKHSQHTLGKAMDFRIPGVDPETVREIALKLQEGGVGYYSPGAGNFSHLDVGSVRAWPRVPRETLARLFPDGKTVHIPADGHPFEGYEEAKAELASRGIGAAVSGSEDDDGGKATAVAANTAGNGSFLASLFGSGPKAKAQPAEQAEDVAQSAPIEALPPQEPTPPARSRMPLIAAKLEQPTSDRSKQDVAAADAPLPALKPRTPQLALNTAPPAPTRSVDTAMIQAPPPPPRPNLVWQTGAAPILKGSAEPDLLAFNQPRPIPRPDIDLSDEGDAGQLADEDMPPVLPVARPHDEMQLAALPAGVTPPPSRPTLPPSEQQASLTQDGPVRLPPVEVPMPVASPLASAHSAFGAPSALGYASVPRDVDIEDLIPKVPERKVAARPPVARPMTSVEMSSVPGIALPVGKADPAAVASRGSLPTTLPILRGDTTTRRAEFAVLTRPDITHMPGILIAPRAVIAVSFSKGVPVAATSSTFEGSAIVQTSLVTFARSQQQALAQ